MKKIIALILVVMMAVSLIGCAKIADVIPDSISNKIIKDETPKESEAKESAKETEAVEKELETEESGEYSETEEEPKDEVAKVSYIKVSDFDYTKHKDAPRYVVSNSEYAVVVVFEIVGEVTDFSISSVEMTNGYDEICEKVFNDMDLSNQNISVYLDFPGDMSTWYYTYTNNYGEKCEHQIYMSGMDGSIVSTDWN